MKKLLLAFMATAMLFSATACFGSKDEPTPKPNETPNDSIVEEGKDIANEAKRGTNDILDDSKDIADKALENGTVNP